MPLNVRSIRSLVKAEQPGMWAARNGLNLVVALSGSASWSVRYTNSEGKRRLMKLADYEPIDEASLAALESDAAVVRKAVRNGCDPLAERAAVELRGTDRNQVADRLFDRTFLDGIEKLDELLENLWGLFSVLDALGHGCVLEESADVCSQSD